MAIAHIVTRGYSTGSNGGTATLVVTRGYDIGVPPLVEYVVFGRARSMTPRTAIRQLTPDTIVRNMTPRTQIRALGPEE